MPPKNITLKMEIVHNVKKLVEKKKSVVITCSHYMQNYRFADLKQILPMSGIST